MAYPYRYHDTLPGSEPIDLYEDKAKKQDHVILSFFKSNLGKAYTPFEIWEKMQHVPITSVRRAITNLEKCGWLIKLNKKKPGGYGRNNCMWTARIKTRQINLFQ